jgi:AbrB family looped-hinge helix DNA binding protein
MTSLTPIQSTDQHLVRVQEKGQVTLPAEVRKSLGIKKGDLVAVTEATGAVVIKPVQVTAGVGSPWLKELYDYFAPVREEIRARGLTEAEVNADIDQAIAEVRRRHG